MASPPLRHPTARSVLGPAVAGENVDPVDHLAWMEGQERAVAALSGEVEKVYPTKALMDADTAQPALTRAYVIATDLKYYWTGTEWAPLLDRLSLEAAAREAGDAALTTGVEGLTASHAAASLRLDETEDWLGWLRWAGRGRAWSPFGRHLFDVEAAEGVPLALDRAGWLHARRPEDPKAALFGDLTAQEDAAGRPAARIDKWGLSHIRRPEDARPAIFGDLEAREDAAGRPYHLVDKWGLSHIRRPEDARPTGGDHARWLAEGGGLLARLDPSGLLRSAAEAAIPFARVEDGCAVAYGPDGERFDLTDGQTPVIEAQGVGPGLVRVVFDRPSHGPVDPRLFGLRAGGVSVPMGGVSEIALMIGQSTGAGSNSNPPFLPPRSPWAAAALMLRRADGLLDERGGVRASTDTVQALEEQAFTGFAPYRPGMGAGGNYNGQSPLSSLADELIEAARLDCGLTWPLILLNAAVGGAGWAHLQPGGLMADGLTPNLAWEKHGRLLRAAVRLARSRGSRAVLRAAPGAWGESDEALYKWADFVGGTGFEASLSSFLGLLTAEAQAVTGQLAPVVQIHMAQGSQSPGWRITSTHALREAARKRPGLIVVAGADYPIHQYVNTLAATDLTHFPVAGTVIRGEYLADAYAEEIGRGRRWRPLDVEALEYDGARGLLVTTSGGSGPLQIDTALVPPRLGHAASMGFALLEATGAPYGAFTAAESVTIAGPNTLQITLPAPPMAAAGSRALTYAAQGHAASANLAEMPGGNIRTATARPSRTGFPRHDWLIPSAVRF